MVFSHRNTLVEKQARHWLDLVRFAESHGFEHDYDRPTAYHYRDFVIKALNSDLPFDTFTKWQLAGDEIAPNDPLALMATGYLAAGVHSTQITKNEAEKHRYDELDDMLSNIKIGTTFMGLFHHRLRFGVTITSSMRSRHATTTGCSRHLPPPSAREVDLDRRPMRATP